VFSSLKRCVSTRAYLAGGTRGVSCSRRAEQRTATGFGPQSAVISDKGFGRKGR
jgi:hypothetical protein